MKDRCAVDLGIGKKGVVARIVILSSVIISAMLMACSSAASTPPSPALPSPEEGVRQHLTAAKKNDAKAWVATLTPGHSKPEDVRLGVISLNIIEVKEEADSRYMTEALASEEAKANGWTKANYAFVSASYDVQYDNSLVPDTNGRKRMVFKLVRLADNSPWLIKDWGTQGFGRDRQAPVKAE